MPANSRDPFHRIFALLCSVAIVRLWLLPMGNSFWLDETLTAWTIQDGFTSIIPRAFVSLQSIGFCMLSWVFAQFGTSEWSLRLPSLIAACATIYVFYRIGAEAADRELGMLLAGLFITAPAVVVEVPNARPYALALLFHAWAAYWLLAWIRSGRLKHGVFWILCAALATHMHHLFVSALPIEVLFVAACMYMRRTQVHARHLSACIVLGVALLLPALPQALVFLGQRRLLSYAGKPTWNHLMLALVPLSIVASVLIVAFVEWTGGRRPVWIGARSGREVALLGSLLFLVPTLFYFVVSHLTDARIFETRYLLPTLPGLVLLWGWVLRGLEPASLRRLSIAGVFGYSILWLGGFELYPNYRGEDWRAAVRAIPEVDGLIVYPGTVETRHVPWLQQPERMAYFLAPVTAYRQVPAKTKAFLLPFEIDATDKAYVESLVAGPLRPARRIAVLVRAGFAGPLWADWLAKRLASDGFREQSSSKFGNVELHVFHGY